MNSIVFLFLIFFIMLSFIQEKMAAEIQMSQLERQSQQQSGASLNVSGVDSSPVDQYEILSKVLGERSDYQRGVGYRVKGKGRKSTSSSTNQSQSQAHTPPRLRKI